MEMFLAVLLAVVAADAPVVSNPGFEQVREQTGLPKSWRDLPQGWHCTSLPNEVRLVCYETTVGEGQESRALQITVAADHPDTKVAYNATQDVKGFVAGKSYRVSAKVRTQGLGNLPMICVQCLDPSGSKFVAFARSPGRALNADIQEWERIETTILVPEGTAIFRLRVGIPSEGNAGGTAMIDDVEVVEARAATVASSEGDQEPAHVRLAS
jgi:hypothetical protein